MPNWPFMIFGQERGGGPYYGDEEKRKNLTFHDYKGLEELLTISDRYVEIPTDRMSNILDRNLRMVSEDYTALIFFQKGAQQCSLGNQDFSADRNKLATYLIVKGISTITNYGFNTCVHGYEAEDRWTDFVSGEGGATLGRALLTQDMIETHGFQKFIDDANHWLPLLEDILQDEVYILGTLAKQSVSGSSLPVKMKFFTLQVLGSSNINAIADTWASVGGEEMISAARSFVNENHLNYVRSWIQSNPYQQEVQNACCLDQPDKYDGDHLIGVDVEMWMTRILPAYNMYQNYNDLNNTFPAGGSGGGCFLPGTLVHVDPKRQKQIEHLRENDVIIGNGGVKGLISNERAGVTLQSPTPVFGFNEDKPFFLGSHPFWSQDGWRALFPSTAREENPWLDIGQLMQGDYVRKIVESQAANLQYEWVKIDKINVEMYPEGTAFHGIHTREGYRTYHANGYLVLQSYPEITKQRVADGVSKLPSKDQVEVIKKLREIETSLAKVVGPDIAKAITGAAQKKAVNSSSGKSNEVVAIKDHYLPKMSFTYEGDVSGYGSYVLPRNACIMRGHLYVDGAFVPTKLISNDKREISWCRPTRNGHWEHGFLKLYQDGLYGKGRVALTANKHDTDKMFSANVSATYKANVFNTSISRDPIKDHKKLPPKSKLKFKPFGPLEYGLEWKENESSPSNFARFHRAIDKKWQDFQGGVQLQIAEDGKMAIVINVPTMVWRILKYQKFYAEFDSMMDNFYGYVQRIEDEKHGYKGSYYAWSGTFEKQDSGTIPEDVSLKNSLLEMARLESLKHPIHDEGNLLTLPIQHSMKDHSSDLPAMVSMLKQQYFVGGSVDDLFSIEGPTSEEMHNTSFKKMTKCMKYNMTDTELNEILGETRDILNGDEQQVADTYKEFLGERFGKCYLLKALSLCDSMSDRIIDPDDTDKLLYYLAGNAEKTSDKISSLSRDTDYIAANNDLGRLAFQELCPSLDSYIKDTNNNNWAEKLYSKLTEPSVLLNLATYASVDHSNRILQKQAMVLNCLAPNGRPENDNDEKVNYATSFYHQVLMTKLNTVTESFSGNQDAKDDMIDIVGDILKVQIQQILDGDGDWNKNVQKTLNDEIKEVQKELNTQTFDELYSKFNEFITATISNAWDKPGYFWDKIFASGSDFLADHPIIGQRMKVIVHVCSIALYGMMAYYMVMSFASFDSLPAEQKASLVLDCAKMALTGFAEVGIPLLQEFYTCFQYGEVSMDLYAEFGKLKAEKSMMKGLKSLIKKAGSFVAKGELTLSESIAKIAAGAGADLPAFERRFAKFFELAKGVAKVIGIIASIVGTVSVGFQIARDIKNGEYPAVITLECIEAACFGIAAIAEIASFAIETVAIPVIGEVCALVGIVVAFVLLFVHRKPPDTRTPAQKWVDNIGGPFLQNKLQTPPKEWLDKYNDDHKDQK